MKKLFWCLSAGGVLAAAAISGCSRSNEPDRSPATEETKTETETETETETKAATASAAKGEEPALSEKVKARVDTRAPLEPLVPQGKTGDPASRPDARRLPSGIEYSVLQQGAAGTPQPDAEVRLHITGWVRSANVLGKEIWNTRKHGIPARYELTKDDLIEGLVEVLSTMRRGERRWVLIPSHLGYGDEGYGDIVPAGSNLVFDVELVDFTNPSAG